MEEQPKYKLCKRGHERSPENIGANGHCLVCIRLRDNARRRLLDIPPRRGEFCRNGHERTVENVDAHGRCVTCRRKNRLGWLERNPVHLRRDVVHSNLVKWKARNGGKVREYSAKHYRENSALRAADTRARTERLAPSYVAARLGLSVKDVPQELMEIKRLTIQLRRKINEQKCN